MGENLALNIARNGFPIVVYNRTTVRTDEYLAGPAAGHRNHRRGRRCQSCVPRWSGRADHHDGQGRRAGRRRARPSWRHSSSRATSSSTAATRSSSTPSGARRSWPRRNLIFVGMGVSGGERRALGPEPHARRAARGLRRSSSRCSTAIAAKVDDGPCVTYIGPGGSGHFVKMVHNGIEYGDMQLIAEAYDIMRRALGMPADEMADVFADWNTRELASYLIEVTADVLRYIDPETGKPLVDLILDAAEQKGTGRWTIESALELASPVPTIDAAVTARNLSALRGLRVAGQRDPGRSFIAGRTGASCRLARWCGRP